jgi:hypothetical protein
MIIYLEIIIIFFIIQYDLLLPANSYVNDVDDVIFFFSHSAHYDVPDDYIQYD